MLSARVATRLAALTAAVLLAGCGSDATDATSDEDDEMTPDQAYSALETEVRSLVEEIGNPGDVGVADPQDVPCGGLGGNERSKLKRTLEAAGGIRPEGPEQVLTEARALVEERGLRLGASDDLGDRVTQVVEGDGFVMTLFVFDDGGVMVTGETDCLPDPDR